MSAPSDVSTCSVDQCDKAEAHNPHHRKDHTTLHVDAQKSPPSGPSLVSGEDVDWQARAEEAEDHLARLRGLLTDKAAFYKACIEVPRTPVKSISAFRAVAMVLYSILDETEGSADRGC